MVTWRMPRARPDDGRTASGDLLAEDYIHPSDKGHERIAEVLVELGFAPLAPAQGAQTGAERAAREPRP